MLINAASIRPSLRGESDKFSWCLYQFMFRHPHHNRVFVTPIDDELDDAAHTIAEFETRHWSDYQILIAFVARDNLTSFVRLRDVMLGHYQAHWHGPLPAHWLDVTDQFWADYQNKGRCILDKHHTTYFSRAETRFTETKHSRLCNWCGQWFHRRGASEHSDHHGAWIAEQDTRVSA